MARKLHGVLDGDSKVLGELQFLHYFSMVGWFVKDLLECMLLFYAINDYARQPSANSRIWVSGSTTDGRSFIVKFHNSLVY